MACHNPKPAWLSRSVESGALVMTFNYGPNKKYFRAPCGKCHGCRADQALAWSIRCLHESTFYQENSFLTLTFDDQHVPEKLEKKPLQDFFKRFRRDGTEVRYFACGELGGLTKRPHYHALIFGHDFREPGKRRKLLANWSNGFVSIDPLTPASVMYVCGYAQKKIEDPDETFVVMSRNPGIGRDFLAAYSGDMQRTGHVVINGQKMPIPRRYKEWFEPLKAGTADYMLNEYSALPDDALAARAAKAISDMRAKKLREKI